MSPWRVTLEPVFTPVFRAWWRMRRPMTLGVRAVLLDAAGRVMLVRHTYTSGWHFPGGGVEKGESALEALVRETAEEAGAAIVGAPQLVGVYSNHANFPNDHILLYRVAEWRACEAGADHEIAERGFFALEALPDGLTKGTRRRLLEIFEGAQQSAVW